jgi:integrase/recombinase XerD
VADLGVCPPQAPPGVTSRRVFIGTALQWFRFHHAVESSEIGGGWVRHEFLREYVRVLEEVHTTNTVRLEVGEISRFLDWVNESGRAMSVMSVYDIDEYLNRGRHVGRTPRTIGRQCEILRGFFRYAESRGWVSRKISKGISSPKAPGGQRTPQGPHWRDVLRLLEANRGTSAREVRSRAVLHLCALYALRASEIERITLDDFDWVNELITIRRSKNGRIQQFPLHYDVGQAVIAYLRYGRPRCSCRNLFISARPPYHFLSSQALRATIRSQLNVMHIESAQRGPHALRHACATRLLQKGSSLFEIADFLGHRGIKSVSVYARHDMKSLQKVADFSLRGLR